MNEHEPHHPDDEEPERPQELTPAPDNTHAEASDATAATVDTVSLGDAPRSKSPEYAEVNVSVVREGIRRYGERFLAYLVLDGVEQRSQHLVEQYEQRYLGSFPDRRSFAAWAIEDQRWNADLVELRYLQGMWAEDVKWDLAALWPVLVEIYAVTERLGGVHAFRR